MQRNDQVKLLKIYVSETDKFKHTPLYEAIVYAAKREKLSGATVLRGIMSFGPDSSIHSLKISDLFIDLPVVIEIVDTKEKIETFMNKYNVLFEKINTGGLITLSDVEVIFSKKRK